MTKQDYEVIAGIVWNTPLRHDVRDLIVLAMCRAFKAQNQNFKPDVFIKACGADVKILLAL